MDLNRLNKLIKRIELITDYLNKNGSDPLLTESLVEHREELENEFGSFLQDILFDIYDEYFEDNEISKLEDYIGSGVKVYGDEFQKGEVHLNVKPSPLRFEIYDLQGAYCDVLWTAA